VHVLPILKYKNPIDSEIRGEAEEREALASSFHTRDSLALEICHDRSEEGGVIGEEGGLDPYKDVVGEEALDDAAV